MQPTFSRSQRVQFALTVFGVLLLAVYAVVAIVAQPLAGTMDVSNRSLTPGNVAAGEYAAYRLFNYVDGGTFTVTKWVTNGGLVPLTITSVDPPPDGWVGLIGVKDARRAVPLVNGSCCEIDEAATWAASGFRPLYLGPGQSGAISVRYLMSNCESSSPGGTVSFETVGIQYNILGVPRDVQIPWSAPVGVTSPDTCPRSRVVPVTG